MSNNKFSELDKSDKLGHIERNKIEKHFKSLIESINACDARRAILISNVLGGEELTIDNVRRLRELATKFNEDCVCIPKREIENL